MEGTIFPGGSARIPATPADQALAGEGYAMPYARAEFPPLEWLELPAFSRKSIGICRPSLLGGLLVQNSLRGYPLGKCTGGI